MVIDLSGEQRLLTVHLDGELDHHSAAKIKSAIEKELRRSGAVNVAFDFSGVSFMDSAGIGMILGRFKTVKSLGGKIIIYGMNREISSIVKMSGLEKIAQVY